MPLVDPAQLGGLTMRSVTGTTDSPPVDSVTDYDLASNACTATLPAVSSANAGKVVIAKLTDATNDLTIDGDGTETIDGSLSITLNIEDETVTLVSDGSTGWFRL